MLGQRTFGNYFDQKEREIRKLQDKVKEIDDFLKASKEIKLKPVEDPFLIFLFFLLISRSHKDTLIFTLHKPYHHQVMSNTYHRPTDQDLLELPLQRISQKGKLLVWVYRPLILKTFPKHLF